MKTTNYLLFISLLSFVIISSCKKPLAPEVEDEVLEDEIVLVSEVIVGDTIGGVGFFYNTAFEHEECYDGEIPNYFTELVTKGIDFDGNSAVDLCFYFSYLESSDGGCGEVTRLTAVEAQNNSLKFLVDTTDNLLIINSAIEINCSSNFSNVFGNYTFCERYAYGCIDGTEITESISGDWCDNEPNYLVFKIENAIHKGIGWVYMNPNSENLNIISYGYQPNIDCE